MTPEDLLRLAHVIGATVLFGTGAGIAFFMVMARRTANPALIAHVSGTVVIADTIFTATAAIIQPVTGYFLARIIGWPLSEGWIALSLCLYVFTGIFWLPVVWIRSSYAISPAIAPQPERRCRSSGSVSTASGLRAVFRLSLRFSASSG